MTALVSDAADVIAELTYSIDTGEKPVTETFGAFDREDSTVLRALAITARRLDERLRVSPAGQLEHLDRF